MNTTRDIYDPPPSQTSWLPPRSEPLRFTQADLICLVILEAIVLAGAVGALFYDALLGILVFVGGTLVVVESWYTALGFLNRRHPNARPWRRVGIIAAALVPWVVGLGLSATLMIGLFVLTDLGA